MGRNIVLCCDGTANEFAADRTNVVKLCYTLVQDPARQVVYYHPGLGTMEPPGALTGIVKKGARLLGQAIGYGLDADVRDAYVFLMNNFRPGDLVYMCGFSRGSYTVRAVASLLKMYGLLPPGNDALVPYAIRMLTGINEAEDAERSSYFHLAGEFKETFDVAGLCKPHFVGVWDTVSSVGWIENPMRLPFTANNPDIAHGRHAVALDERRAFFWTNLWWPKGQSAASGPKDLKQIWFPGVHADVGGGYPESESGLAKISLKWMLDEAETLGLLCDADRKAKMLGERGGPYVRPNPLADMHESLTLKWWPAEFVLKKNYDRERQLTSRRMNLGRYREIPSGSHIHRSAYLRGDAYSKRLPSDAIPVD
jgi:uncharacterized protein (DUF2235 family)